MKIRELLAILAALPPEHEVIVSADAEGNHYAPAAKALPACYRPYRGSHGTRGDLAEEGEAPDNAVVLWPV